MILVKPIPRTVSMQALDSDGEPCGLRGERVEITQRFGMTHVGFDCAAKVLSGEYAGQEFEFNEKRDFEPEIEVGDRVRAECGGGLSREGRVHEISIQEIEEQTDLGPKFVKRTLYWLKDGGCFSRNELRRIS